MTPEFVESLNDRVAEFGSLAVLIDTLKASADIEPKMVDVLGVLRDHLEHLTDKLDALTGPARAMLEDRA